MHSNCCLYFKTQWSWSKPWKGKSPVKWALVIGSVEESSSMLDSNQSRKPVQKGFDFVIDVGCNQNLGIWYMKPNDTKQISGAPFPLALYDGGLNVVSCFADEYLFISQCSVCYAFEPTLVVITYLSDEHICGSTNKQVDSVLQSKWKWCTTYFWVFGIIWIHIHVPYAQILVVQASYINSEIESLSHWFVWLIRIKQTWNFINRCHNWCRYNRSPFNACFSFTEFLDTGNNLRTWFSTVQNISKTCL